MPFSKCEDVIERLAAIADEEAGLVDRMRFFAHLAMCPDCRRYYDQYIAVKNAVGAVGSEDLVEDFDRVMGFVLEETVLGDAHQQGPPADGGEREPTS